MRYVDREEEKKEADFLVSPSFGALLAEDNANAIFFMNRPSFWKIKEEMLGQGDDDHLAQAAKKIMEDFDPVLMPQDPAKIYAINNLLKLID